MDSNAHTALQQNLGEWQQKRGAASKGNNETARDRGVKSVDCCGLYLAIISSYAAKTGVLLQPSPGWISSFAIHWWYILYIFRFNSTSTFCDLKSAKSSIVCRKTHVRTILHNLTWVKSCYQVKKLEFSLYFSLCTVKLMLLLFIPSRSQLEQYSEG